MSWVKKLEHLTPISSVQHLPSYAAIFFFQHCNHFRLAFVLLTFVRVLSSLLKFYTVYLLGDVISGITTVSIDSLLWWYLPLLLGTYCCCELLDYFTRRFGEALPTIYGEYTSVRILYTLLKESNYKIFNFSKERLSILVNKYVAHITKFLNDWTWGITGHITTLIIVFTVLGIQSPIILAINLLYILVFLLLAFRLSRRFSILASDYAHKDFATQALLQNFTIALNLLKKMRLESFFLSSTKEKLTASWKSLEQNREFHAFRWIIQLNIFNILYVGTLGYGAYQVKTGTLSLGYLVLIKWAFDSLWNILVYIIEYYVSLVQQREDVAIIRRELAPLCRTPHTKKQSDSLTHFGELTLTNIATTFVREVAKGEESFTIKVPAFSLRRGDKVGIIGPSGSGKSTIFGVLMGTLPYAGTYTLNNEPFDEDALSATTFSIVSTHDPLLKLTLRENLLLGAQVDEVKLTEVLAGLCISEFCTNLDAVVGSEDFNLSAGQEQRIRIARGLLRNADILILDEPFSGIDHETKLKIMHFLAYYLESKTVLLATHIQDELRLTASQFIIRNGVLVPA